MHKNKSAGLGKVTNELIFNRAELKIAKNIATALGREEHFVK